MSVENLSSQNSDANEQKNEIKTPNNQNYDFDSRVDVPTTKPDTGLPDSYKPEEMDNSLQDVPDESIFDSRVGDELDDGNIDNMNQNLDYDFDERVVTDNDQIPGSPENTETVDVDKTIDSESSQNDNADISDTSSVVENDQFIDNNELPTPVESPDKAENIAVRGNQETEKKVYEPNSKYLEEDGHTVETDDNGNVYRRDDTLLPDNTYVINDYEYKTDSMGKIVSAEGQVHLKDHKGRLEIKDSKEVIGRGDERETDDRGHLVGDQLGGSNGMENIVAQDAKINQGDYKKLEDKLASEVKNGKDVYIKVEPIYGDKNSYRPTAIKYTSIVNGEKNITVFPNGR